MKTLWALVLAVGICGCAGAPPTATDSEAYGRPDPCRVRCHAEFDECNHNCGGDNDPQLCMCLCQNSQALCIGACNGGGTPPLRDCPPPDYDPNK
jgi:hypothetical protein